MKILIHNDQPERARDIVARRHPDLAIAVCRDYASMGEVLAQERPEAVYTVRFAGTPSYPRAAMLSAPSLKWIAVGGSGTDHLMPWDTSRLTVTNSAGVAAEAMAQYIIGGILHFTLGFAGFAKRQREHVWDKAATVDTVNGRSLAILGLGSGMLDVAPGAIVGDLVQGRGGPVFAAYTMSSDVGSVVGPIVAGRIADVSYGAAFAMTASILGFAALMGVVAPETRGTAQPMSVEPPTAHPEGSPAPSTTT